MSEPPIPHTAVILAGGLGTRLRSALPDSPKVLATVGGRPFVTYLLDQLSAFGVQQAILCVGYLGEQVRMALGERHDELILSYSVETQPLGTAGALAQALPLCAGDPVLALNGDSYCQADLGAWARWHAEKEAAASLLLVHQPDAMRFGQVVVDAEGRVVRFEEKGRSGAGWINAGLYLLSRRFLESIPTGRAVSIEREVYPAWTGRGLYAYSGGGRFLDIGTPESYAQAEAFFRAFRE